MAKSTQLKLVTEGPPEHGHSADPVRVAFEHYVAAFGFNPRRTKLDAQRRQVLDALLALYDLDTVLLGIDGMAAVPMGGKPQSMVDTMSELAWFGATAARFERAIRHGERLQAMLHEAQAGLHARQEEAAEAPSPEEEARMAAVAAASRAQLRELQAKLRAQHG